MSDFNDVVALARLLGGEPPGPIDWPRVVNLANRTLLTPALASAPHLAQAPQDIRTFVEATGQLNRARNRRLLAQLSDAAEALERAGLECTVLKGAALLLTCPHAAAGRVLSDLDLLVDGEAVSAAIAALEGVGFAVLSRYANDDAHVAAELHREGDVGMIDLHRRAPGPRSVLSSMALARRFEQAPVGAAHVRAPSSDLQILHLAMHDLFHEGDYWSGALDLRHLHDVALLSAQEPDWGLFSRDLLGPLGVRGARRYLLTASRLFGATVPPALRQDAGARLQHWRSMTQLRAPALRPWLIAGGLLAEAPAALGHYARERHWRHSHAVEPTSRKVRLDGRVARLAQVFAPPFACKV